MTSAQATQALRMLLVVSHVSLVAAFLGMGLPALANIREQIASGYVPGYYDSGWFVGLVASPFVASALALLGLVATVPGRRWWLIGIDALLVAMSWSVLVVFIVVNSLPIVTTIVAPITLTLSIAWGWLDRPSARSTPSRSPTA